MGSPIIKDNLFKNEDDTMDPSELFKEVNFKSKIPKNPYYVSIVRPSNNFNFGSLNEFTTDKKPEIKTKISPRNKDIEEKKQIKTHLPAINLDLDKKIYKSNKIDILKYYDMKLLSNKTSNLQKNISIKQKLQDVFFQLHKPNDISQFNVYPSKMNYQNKANNLYLNNNFNNMPSNLFTGSPRKKEDYFADVYKMMNPYGAKSSVKSVTDKIYRIMRKDKAKNEYYRFSSGKKNAINQKLEGLNQILNAKGDDFIEYNNNDKILSEDDFISLEDKMKQFEKRKMQINHPERKLELNNEQEDAVNIGNSGIDEIKMENKEN